MFDNIFLGLGLFHMEGTVLAAIGKFLEITGINQALSESRVFGPDIVDKKVMSGKHYVKSKDGMALIAEVMNTLILKQFL